MSLLLVLSQGVPLSGNFAIRHKTSDAFVDATMNHKTGGSFTPAVLKHKTGGSF